MWERRTADGLCKERLKKKKGKKIKAVIQTELVRQRRLVQRMRKRKEQISPPKNIKKKRREAGEEETGRGGEKMFENVL